MFLVYGRRISFCAKGWRVGITCGWVRLQIAESTWEAEEHLYDAEDNAMMAIVDDFRTPHHTKLWPYVVMALHSYDDRRQLSYPTPRALVHSCHVCMRMCMHGRACACICTCACMCMHSCMCARVCMHVCTCACACIGMFDSLLL